MRLRESKWEEFLDGFGNILYILDCYDAGDKWGYGEFWEALSYGWMAEYIYPYDDWYQPSKSKEREMRLGQTPKGKTIYVSQEAYDKLQEMIAEPAKPNPKLIELLNRKTPWDETNG